MKNYSHTTKSLCNICYRQIHAGIYTENELVMMDKVCPIHGKQTGVVETSVEVFETLGFGRCNPDFLPRLLIFNLTGSCNTQCDFCYNPLKGVNMTAIEVVDIARLFPGWKIVLSGGEPTIHPDYWSVVTGLSNYFATITNGIKFLNERFMDTMHEMYPVKSYIPFYLTLNSTSRPMLDRILTALYKNDYVIRYAFFVLERLDQIDEAMNLWRDNQDVITHLRFRLPFNSWNQSATKTFFLSEVYLYLQKNYPDFTLCDALVGNSIYDFTLQCGDRLLTVCSAPSLSAFDIDHIQQAPFMLANDGEIYSTPHTLLINEGIEKGIIKCYAPHLNLNTQD